MKVLSLSDVVIDFIYSGQVKQRFNNIDLVLGCGDLPYYYLEYILTMLNTPLFFVRGNHANVIEYGAGGSRKGPHGGIDLHRKSIEYKGFLFAGVEGSLRYREGPFQYSQKEMWGHALYLAPKLLMNKMLYGRYLDVFISHAPPQGIHDQDDRPHQGIAAFCWLIRVFKPLHHFHGHIHVYHPSTVTETLYNHTRVINTYGYRELTI